MPPQMSRQQYLQMLQNRLKGKGYNPNKSKPVEQLIADVMQIAKGANVTANAAQETATSAQTQIEDALSRESDESVYNIATNAAMLANSNHKQIYDLIDRENEESVYSTAIRADSLANSIKTQIDEVLDKENEDSFAYIVDEVKTKLYALTAGLKHIDENVTLANILSTIDKITKKIEGDNTILDSQLDESDTGIKKRVNTVVIESAANKSDIARLTTNTYFTLACNGPIDGSTLLKWYGSNCNSTFVPFNFTIKHIVVNYASNDLLFSDYEAKNNTLNFNFYLDDGVKGSVTEKITMSSNWTKDINFYNEDSSIAFKDVKDSNKKPLEFSESKTLSLSITNTSCIDEVTPANFGNVSVILYCSAN